jgi:hypothetical protein
LKSDKPRAFGLLDYLRKAVISLKVLLAPRGWAKLEENVEEKAGQIYRKL